jgi:hypothetical protein
MQEQFSREPPVYAKPSDASASPHPVVSQGYQRKPPPPLPTSTEPFVKHSPSVSSPVTSHTVTISDRPAIPPKPILPSFLSSVAVRSPTPQSSDQHVSVELHTSRFSINMTFLQSSSQLLNRPHHHPLHQDPLHLAPRLVTDHRNTRARTLSLLPRSLSLRLVLPQRVSMTLLVGKD